jgi:hypothetical protein
LTSDKIKDAMKTRSSAQAEISETVKRKIHEIDLNQVEADTSNY